MPGRCLGTTLCLRDRDLDWRGIDNEIVAGDRQQAVYLAVRGAGAEGAMPG